MKVVRIFLYVTLLIVLIGLGAFFYLKKALPSVKPAPDMKVEGTPAQVERGRYLANYVAVCMDCHSTRDWSRFSGPLVEGTLGKGGERFPREFGFPGEYYSKNITPAGIGDWTDGEVFRAITSGVDKNGKALFPLMPYPHYGMADEEDIKAIIAYIRTLAPIKNKVPESETDFPMNLILNTIPEDPEFKPKPTNPIEYGGYLANMASCVTCHTQVDKGKLVEGKEWSGGREFPMPGFGTVRSANITFDTKTGIGNWSREAFIKRFKYYADSAYTPHMVSVNQLNTIMPWTMYAQMTSDDLGAIYDYLKTLKPINNPVEKFSPGMREDTEQAREREEHQREQEEE